MIIHCLEKLTSNLGIIDWYMLNLVLSKKIPQQTGNNDVSQQA